MFHVGARFGRLVLKEKDIEKRKWICICDCGIEKSIHEAALFKGTRSCTCLKWPHKEEYHQKKREFLEKTTARKNGCWIWEKSKNRIGYGATSYRSKSILAHRLAWIVFHGDIPQGMKICHSCDERSCVNPDHLFIGTQRDNIRDMFIKGRRSIKFFNHPRCLMSIEKIKEIRSLLSMGLSQKRIAEIMVVSQSTISQIKLGKRWSHIA
jgi:HNH endonuclease